MTADSENGTGVCIKTAMNYTLAQSPAFDIEGISKIYNTNFSNLEI